MNSKMEREYVNCNKCDGHGYQRSGERCEWCKGHGKVERYTGDVMVAEDALWTSSHD